MSEEKRELGEKEQRAIDCMTEIKEVLKKHNAVLAPIRVEGPDENGQMRVQYDVVCVAKSLILENAQ